MNGYEKKAVGLDFFVTVHGQAINAIVRTFQKRTAAGLQSGRNFVIPDKQEQATKSSDFELIIWLVIKGDRL